MSSSSSSDVFGDDDVQILRRFRRFTRSHVEHFRAARNRVSELLGSSQRYLSGTFREELLRDFLRKILPDGVAVDSGVIYGFEQIPNSAQIDVLIWDNYHYPPVFRAQNFSVVPPESVIAAISVKTRAERADYDSSIANLMSVADLDRGFRTEPSLKPIAKIAVFYDSPRDEAEALNWVRGGLIDNLSGRPDVVSEVKEVLRKIEPVEPAEQHQWFVERVYPRLFAAIDDPSPFSIIRGWGPPERTREEALAEEFRREPYIYAQSAKLTTPIEKVAYHVMSEVFLALGRRGGSILSAWGDFHPQYHFRVGDAGELNESSGLSVLPNGDDTGASKEARQIGC